MMVNDVSHRLLNYLGKGLNFSTASSFCFVDDGYSFDRSQKIAAVTITRMRAVVRSKENGSHESNSMIFQALANLERQNSCMKKYFCRLTVYLTKHFKQGCPSRTVESTRHYVNRFILKYSSIFFVRSCFYQTDITVEKKENLLHIHRLLLVT